jgi:hypothetical protein
MFTGLTEVFWNTFVDSIEGSNFMTEDDIQKALDDLFDSFGGHQNLVSVGFDGKAFGVRFESIPKSLDRSQLRHTVFDSEINESVIFPIEYEESAPISLALGSVEKHKPFQEAGPITIPTPVPDFEGGDPCQAERDRGSYGTITSVFRRFDIQGQGRCNFLCETAPAIVSNNHVIAASDQAKVGDGIFLADGSGLRIGSFNCSMPFNCDADMDIATGKPASGLRFQGGRIKGIGITRAVDRPFIGQKIQKFGARTGYKTGRVTGQSNIVVGGYRFRRVFSVSGGFGCAGDSGSAVIQQSDPNNTLLGIFSWGEIKPCADNPIGYFFPVVRPGESNGFSNDGTNGGLRLEFL